MNWFRGLRDSGVKLRYEEKVNSNNSRYLDIENGSVITFKFKPQERPIDIHDPNWFHYEMGQYNNNKPYTYEGYVTYKVYENDVEGSLELINLPPGVLPSDVPLKLNFHSQREFNSKYEVFGYHPKSRGGRKSRKSTKNRKSKKNRKTRRRRRR